MLSDNSLEKLMQPVIERQEKINNYVIGMIAKRIKEIGELKSSDVYKLTRLFQSGSDIRKINKELARLTGLQEKDIRHIIQVCAEEAYIDAKPFFEMNERTFIPLAENVALNRIIRAVQKQTINEYRNLCKAQAFMIRDRKNPKVLKPTSIAKTYQSVVDEAVQSVQSGTIDYNTAMRRTLRQLNDSGIRYVEYNTESGRTYTQRLDTAIRRNILDGVRAINQGVQDEVGKEFGSTGKEISVHLYPAPDHEPVQGHQFTNEEYEKLQNNQPFQDINGVKFKAIARPIGVLNCRHFTWSIMAGITKPNYTQHELDKIIERNHKGYTDSNGKHYTMYECTQEQRRLETMVRRMKDGQIAAKTAGDITLAKEYQAKISKYTKQYESFSNACGLQQHKSKMRVSGYKRV